MSHYVLIANYGNESIALMQWVIEAELATQSTLVSINTGWAGEGWQQRVQAAEAYAQQHALHVVRLNTPATFQALVADRQAFPSKKFQWCASLLKGITINAWLDQQDPLGKCVILLAKRDSNLPEFIEHSEYYQQRNVWHPLRHHTLEQRDALVSRAGFAVLAHRSLECEPCIHSAAGELRRLAQTDIAKTACLEEETRQTMFSCSIEQMVAQAQQDCMPAPTLAYQEMAAMGCGSPWGCGE